jgi:hypothetical protein
VLVDQPLVATRLLDRRQVLALDVLDQCQLEQGLLADVAPHDHGNFREPRARRRPEPALAGDELVATLVLGHQQRLKNTVGADGIGELGKCGIIEMAPWLAAPGRDPFDLDQQRRTRGLSIDVRVACGRGPRGCAQNSVQSPT